MHYNDPPDSGGIPSTSKAIEDAWNVLIDSSSEMDQEALNPLTIPGSSFHNEIKSEISLKSNMEFSGHHQGFRMNSHSNNEVALSKKKKANVSSINQIELLKNHNQIISVPNSQLGNGVFIREKTDNVLKSIMGESHSS
ncbi:hypothetical protein WA026_014100 [Henosepilachna vigintioctopunctata]|uniref:Uncharacterized protein n=1 Tax=Henosepilachna vigintioctopunctata TaxID=420089 RepID=A0AAW1TTB2_9CUCU